jgi:hypothetical protein
MSRCGQAGLLKGLPHRANLKCASSALLVYAASQAGKREDRPSGKSPDDAAWAHGLSVERDARPPTTFL